MKNLPLTPKQKACLLILRDLGEAEIALLRTKEKVKNLRSRLIPYFAEEALFPTEGVEEAEFGPKEDHPRRLTAEEIRRRVMAGDMEDPYIDRDFPPKDVQDRPGCRIDPGLPSDEGSVFLTTDGT